MSLPEFHILGPLGVRSGGRPAALGGPKERALLALLVLHANRVLSTDRLVEELWGEAAPEQAMAALRVYVSHLRKALGANGDGSISTCAPGYLLRLAPEQLDATLFEQLAVEGHEHLREGRPELAAVRFRDGLALWRGPALADVADAAFAQPEIARLEELRLGAIEGRVEADLACGRHTELVGELRALVGEHPLRERLWASRILALYRAGRQAEALAAYQELRRTLSEEVGLDPSPELAALERAVLAHDPALLPTPSARGDAPPARPAAAPRPAEPSTDEQGSLRLSSALVTLREPGFVGRAPEIVHLEAAWQRAQAGARQVVLIAGEPGMGKTALAVHVAGATWADGALVLFGRCDEESLVPFQPFVEALAHYVQGTPSDRLRAQLGSQAADLALLLPELRRRLPELADTVATGADTERYRLFEAVPALLRAVAQEAPVVLVLDDLHWADRPTLQLLQHLIRRTAEVPLLVLGTYRDTDLVRTHPMAETLAELRRANLVDRVPLRGLTRDDVVALVSAGGEAGPTEQALAEALWQQTEGSPLFLREILRHLSETGAIAQEGDGHWSPRRRIEQLGIPEGVKEVIGRRLTRLSEVANVALRTGSVMGRTFRLDVLEAVTDASTDALLDALEEATSSGIVNELPGGAGRYTFTHALVRDALYDELSLTRRVRLHQRVGEALETLVAGDIGPHLAELAYHFSQAAVAAGPDRAIDYARRAGEYALTLSAYEEAARHFANALEVAEDGGSEPGLRADLLLAMGRAQWRAGNPRVPRATFERVVALIGASDPERLARAALAYAGAGLHFIWADLGIVTTRSVGLLEASLSAMPEADSRLRARLLACLAQTLYFSLETERRREELSAEAVAMARRLHNPTTLAEVLNARCLAIYSPDNAAELVANTAEMLAIAEALGDAELAVFAHALRCIAAQETGDAAEFTGSLDELARLADALNFAQMREIVAFIRSSQRVLEGRFAEAEALLHEGLRHGREAGDAAAIALFFGALIPLRILQGRASEVIHFPLVLPVVFPLSAPYGHAMAAATFAMVGMDAEARRHLEQVEPASLPRNLPWKYCAALLALACARLQDRERAAAVHELLLPHAGTFMGGSGSMGFGPASWPLGLTAMTAGRLDEAEGHFEHALAVSRDNGWPVIVAHVQVGLAAMLVIRARDDDRERARTMAATALGTARELGLRAVAGEAERLLGVIAGAAAQPPPVETPRPRRATRRDRLRTRVMQQGRSAVARLSRDHTDEALTRRFGSTLAQRALFTAMAHAFRPRMALGFEGSIVFELVPVQDGADPAASDWWTVDVRAGSASARRGRGADATLTLRAGLADFVRLLSGELNPVQALMERRFDYEGDVLAATRLAEMFGAVEPVDLPSADAEARTR
jgi:DNA-binding SARP family transcriptional activator